MDINEIRPGIIKRVRFWWLNRKLERGLKIQDDMIERALQRWPDIAPIKSPIGATLSKLHEENKSMLEEMEKIYPLPPYFKSEVKNEP